MGRTIKRSMDQTPRSFGLNSAIIGALAVLAAACAAPATGPQVAQPAPDLPPAPAQAEGPQLSDPIKVAAVLPLSGPQARLGQAMAQAIQMAFFEASDPRFTLKFFDSLGSDATAQTRQDMVFALSDYGPKAVIGPLFSQNAQALAPVLLEEGVPLLSFSNDMAANAAGAILLGQQPEQEVARVLAFVADQAETRRLGMIVPDDMYGARVRTAMLATMDALNAVLVEERNALMSGLERQTALLQSREFAVIEDPAFKAVSSISGALEDTPALANDMANDFASDFTSEVGSGADGYDLAAAPSQPEPLVVYTLTAEERYERNLRTLDGPARRVAQFDARTAEVERERAFLTELDDPMGLDYLDSIRNIDTFRQPGYDILLVAEGGQLLRALAPMLTVYAIDEKETQLIGTGLWNDPGLAREPALHGGLFAAAPPEATQPFVARYSAQYGARPPALGATAYDAMAILALAARDEFGAPSVFDPSRLFAASGFRGASGLFRLLPSGVAERTLAVMRITESGLETVDEAPGAFPMPELPEMSDVLEESGDDPVLDDQAGDPVSR